MQATSHGAHPDTDEDTIMVDPTQLANTMITEPKKSEPQLVLLEGKAFPNRISLKGKSSIKIGKDPTCDMVLKDLFVANAQAYIVAHGDQFKVIPQRSWTNIYLNSMKIKSERFLQPGDIIKIRSIKITYYG